MLGLSYFWSGAQNAVELQVWATWLLYAVLVDLTDAVAEAIHRSVWVSPGRKLRANPFHRRTSYSITVSKGLPANFAQPEEWAEVDAPALAESRGGRETGPTAGGFKWGSAILLT